MAALHTLVVDAVLDFSYGRISNRCQPHWVRCPMGAVTPVTGHDTMEPYTDTDGDSSVVGYELEPEGIRVYFETAAYLYNYSKPGREHVEAMKKLAVAGTGLNHYIGQYVGRRYADKITRECASLPAGGTRRMAAGRSRYCAGTSRCCLGARVSFLSATRRPQMVNTSSISHGLNASMHICRKRNIVPSSGEKPGGTSVVAWVLSCDI